MARRLIGTGITNNQGIAIMNTDPQGNPITGYTGTGAGKIQIIAESGQLTSEQYTITDCTFYDTCTTNHDQWIIYQSDRLNITHSGSGMTVTGTSSDPYNLYANKKGTSTAVQDFEGELAVEFTATVPATNGATFQIYDLTEPPSTSNLYQKTIDNQLVTGTSQIKFTYKDNQIKCYVDDTLVSTTSNVEFTEKFRIGFRGYVDWSIIVKNFMVYPI